MKHCAACKELKAPNEFAKNTALRDGLNSSCRACIKIRARKQYQKHKEQRLANKAAYREANRTRLMLQAREYRKRSQPVRKAWERRNMDKLRLTAARRRATKRQVEVFVVTPKDVRSLLSRPCAYCGGVAEHIDHVIPLSRGGCHAIGNLAPACSTCNLRKNKKLVIEWKRRRNQESRFVQAHTTTALSR